MIERSDIKRVQLFGFSFVADHNFEAILKEVRERVEHQEGGLPVMITPNVDQTVKYRRKEVRLYDRLKHAQYILPDGQPLIAFSRLKRGKRLPARLTGSDFFPKVWAVLQEMKENVGFIVASEGIAGKLKEEYDGAYTYVPPFFDHRIKMDFDQEVARCVDMVIEKKLSHLFIGLGFPKQELLCLAILDRLRALRQPPPFIYLLGAAMEFYTGQRKRAPRIYQKLGLEFLHRLLTEPRRMAKRYLIDDLAFIPLAVRELAKRG